MKLLRFRILSKLLSESCHIVVLADANIRRHER